MTNRLSSGMNAVSMYLQHHPYQVVKGPAGDLIVHLSDECRVYISESRSESEMLLVEVVYMTVNPDFPDVVVPTVYSRETVRQESPHKLLTILSNEKAGVRHKQRKWVWTSIIANLAIAAGVFYYLSRGSGGSKPTGGSKPSA